MNLIKKIKLNSRQKAIGVILIFPWYLYFAPIVINYFLKLYTVYIANDFSTNSLNAFFNLFIGIATAIPLIIVFKGFIKENWLVFKKDFLENIIWVLTIGIGLAYLFSIAGELIVNLVAPQSGEAANQTLVETLVQSNFLLMFFQSVIIAPFIEELLFRGLIFNSLRQKNMVWAHLISAFLFGLLHVYSYILAGDMREWIKLIPYMMAGLSFSTVYEKRQTIIAPIILHAAKNLIAVLLMATMF